MRYAVFENWRTADIASPRRAEAISDRYPLFKLLGECLQRFRMNREEHQFPQDLGIRGTRDGRDYVLGKRSKAGFQQIPQSQAQAFRSSLSPSLSSSNHHTLLDIFIFPLGGTFFQHGINLTQILKFWNLFHYPGAFQDDTAQPYRERPA